MPTKQRLMLPHMRMSTDCGTDRKQKLFQLTEPLVHAEKRERKQM